MDSLPPFLWGSFIPYNMPVYPGAFPVKSSCRKLTIRWHPIHPFCPESPMAIGVTFRHAPHCLPLQFMSPTLSSLLERWNRHITLASLPKGFSFRLYA